MQPLYLVAVIGTRLIGVLLMLALSYLMSPSEFGKFTLINTNALLIQMLGGSWLVSIANRELVSDGGRVNRDIISAVASAAILVAAAVLCTGAVYAFYYYEQLLPALWTVALAVVFMIYDITLAAKNAIGRESAYASFAVCRNVLALALSVSFVAVGMGWLGPVAGLLLGTVVPLLLLPPARSVWAEARPSWSALAASRKYVALGMSGGLILGIYILVNAPTRNLIAQNLGKASSGVWTLCGDLFYGPLAVIGNAYALSQVRLMYLAAANADENALDSHSRSLMEFTLSIAVPYALGSFLFAADAMALVLSRSQAILAVDVAAPAAVQGAAVLVLYSLTSIALAKRRFWMVTAMVISTVSLASLATFAGKSLTSMAYLSMSGTLVGVSFWLVWSATHQIVQIRLAEVYKLIVAGTAMWLVAVASRHFMGLHDGAWALAALAGAASYAIVAFGVRLYGFIDVLPSSIRGRIIRGVE